MSQADDLLALARYLTRHEPRRPKQATLRRAVSTAYYALFHRLTESAAAFVVAGRERGELRLRTRRVFQHTTMREVSGDFASNRTAFVPLVPAPLRSVADAFVRLQEQRHSADYDLSTSFTRREAGRLVSTAERAFAEWEAVRGTPEADTYLLALLFGRRWGR